jgi:hypothetical protein
VNAILTAETQRTTREKNLCVLCAFAVKTIQPQAKKLCAAISNSKFQRQTPSKINPSRIC